MLNFVLGSKSLRQALPGPGRAYPDFKAAAGPRQAAKEGTLSMGAVADALSRAGMAPEGVGCVLRTLGGLRQQAHWYERHWKPREAETVVHLVVPLLRALGWTPPLMALGWQHMDVALYHAVPRTQDNLAVIVEVKRMGRPLGKVVHQAASYATEGSRCRLVATDGIRYSVYTQDRRAGRPHAHLDLLDLRSSYGSISCGGAIEALLALRPESANLLMS
jgi:hypothetical protein